MPRAQGPGPFQAPTYPRTPSGGRGHGRGLGRGGRGGDVFQAQAQPTLPPQVNNPQRPAGPPPVDLHFAEDENAPLEEPTYARWVTGHSQEYHENTEGHYDYEQEDQYDYAPNNNDYDEDYYYGDGN